MKTQPGYEFFDHTADVGVRVYAAARPELLLHAAKALYAVIGDLVPESTASPKLMEVEGRARPGAALLVRDFLAELLLLFESEHRMAVDIDLHEFDERRLRLTAHVALVDVARSVYHREVKAVTYHELEWRETAAGCELTFILDI